MEENKDNKENAAPVEAGGNKEEEKKRKVVIGPEVKVIFSGGGSEEVVMSKRDIFSVMNTITNRLAKTKSREEMEAITVSVHSVESPEKSDPPAEGEERFEGPYLVAGLEIEGMKIPEAASELTKGVIPGDAAIKQFELLSEQLFLRSMMDTVTIVAGFSTGMAIIPLINSMRDVEGRTLVEMYHGLHDAAERLRAFCTKNFPDKGINFDKRPEDAEAGKETSLDGTVEKKIVLPSGLPASMAEKGVVTPEEARKDQVKVVHLV
jgi:hypothetical protein